MAGDERFLKHFERLQERKRAEAGASEGEEQAPPVEQAKTQRVAGRNDPCPCGSGRKYKKCCGKS